MRVLIVGAGIAGPTLAYWLQRFGLEVTLVERASRWEAATCVLGRWLRCRGRMRGSFHG
ncbi:MAG: FAD-dependent oxidoreductase [Trueperaceae bacterium]|nr:FAD-dependent oxidoreductase [Trueperaceae bacterium]